jgi:hypothetical protein
MAPDSKVCHSIPTPPPAQAGDAARRAAPGSSQRGLTTISTRLFGEWHGNASLNCGTRWSMCGRMPLRRRGLIDAKWQGMSVLLEPVETSKIRDEFAKLLDEPHVEQRYQQFMEQNTVLIPREFVQNHGVHLDLVFRKISLAKDYAPDFFYLSKSSTDWNLVLVEIEKPHSRYFKDQSNELHPNFLAGLDQIARWRAWFDNPANFSGFIDGTIAPVRVPEAMRRNKSYIKYVLVHGRRAEFGGNELRRALIRAREADDFKILSFDSLLESLHTKSPLYLCVRKNEQVEIVSDKFIDESVFSWVEPSQLKITDALRDDIVRNRSQWRHHRNRDELVLDCVLPLVGRCAP